MWGNGRKVRAPLAQDLDDALTTPLRNEQPMVAIAKRWQANMGAVPQVRKHKSGSDGSIEESTQTTVLFNELNLWGRKSHMKANNDKQDRRRTSATPSRAIEQRC